MTFPLKSTILVVALVCSVTVASGGILDGINEAMDSLACPWKYTAAYDNCSSIASPFYRIQSAYLEDDRKERCCSLLALRDCTKAISYIMCGSETSTTELIVNTVKTLTIECIGVDGITDCMHPFLLVIFALPFLFILIAIFKCLFFCLGCTKRASRRAYRREGKYATKM